MGPLGHELQGNFWLSHGLGDDNIAGGLSDFVRSAEDGGDLAETQSASRLFLEVVSLEPGLDEIDMKMGVEDCNRDTRESGTTSQVGEALGFGKLWHSR